MRLRAQDWTLEVWFARCGNRRRARRTHSRLPAPAHVPAAGAARGPGRARLAARRRPGAGRRNTCACPRAKSSASPRRSPTSTSTRRSRIRQCASVLAQRAALRAQGSLREAGRPRCLGSVTPGVPAGKAGTGQGSPLRKIWSLARIACSSAASRPPRRSENGWSAVVGAVAEIVGAAHEDLVQDGTCSRAVADTAQAGGRHVGCAGNCWQAPAISHDGGVTWSSAAASSARSETTPFGPHATPHQERATLPGVAAPTVWRRPGGSGSA